MSFSFMSGFKPSEEERKKRREQFDSNQAKLGLGAAAAGRGSFLEAGKLGQQAQLGVGAITAPTPAQAQMQASVQAGRQTRNQALAQIETNKQDQAKTQAATLEEARKVVQLPVREQPQAVQQMKAQVQERAGLATTPVVAKPSLDTGVMNSPEPKPSPNAGLVNNPNAAKLVNVNDETIAKEARAEQGIDDDASVLNPVYSEGVTRGNPDNKKFGLSVDNNAAVAQPLAPATQSSQPNLGFNIPRAPMRSWGERQEREALIRDASTAYKGSQNGQLTANQMELRAGIIGADDKYKNDQYNSQLGAASEVAQTQATQAGANARAALSEVGSNSRLNTQLGFDADKFQQTAAQQEQQLGLNSRRLDIEQASNDVQNYSTKATNNLYEKYQTAETDDQKSEINAQIQMLKGSSSNSDKEYWTSIGGGETLSADGLTPTKNPDVLLNRNTGETRSIPLEPIDYANDPRALVIKNNTSLSNEERRKQLEALR